ncbi:UvrD-helicase domain-containing protein [Chondromyces crocatus]|uniref:DNA 3'-5' helicase n=1 Tax=Chondromyces crocatus TaxID=52 RepID=A0A0K1EHY0_CHOCO|nr:UvrD-helicase domain-containing protein [Chondromyces crocatus]AKT40287.1 ATPase AAA [Chondromyces crocatus]
MRFHADLHVHSHYSRATSSDCDLLHLSYWARRKGIAVIGTGDFTHPAWMQELKEQLVPAEPGLFRLRDDVERTVQSRLEPTCRDHTRFMLSVEISTIYKKGERTRKIHHLIYAPDFDAADRLVKTLSKVGNLNADGRPILGLDSRHLLEAVLASGEGSYLVPAHIWTPWFSVLGSKAGFDAVDDCYGDLAKHIFALETGLSSDPAMNWRISALDRYRLVSSSDAHSPAKLGREATRFETELDYYAIRRALETGEGFGGTLEFFPEEGKYHLDGHRQCRVVMGPEETRAHKTICPVCRKPVTVGVLHRVEDLADRDEGFRLEGASDFRSLIPLPEILAELHGVGPSSKTVQRSYDNLLTKLGPELSLLQEMPIDQLDKVGPPRLGEAIARMRAGDVIRQAGYDGEYGVIRLFHPEELKRGRSSALLFEDPPPEPQVARTPVDARPDVATPQPTQRQPHARGSAPVGVATSAGVPLTASGSATPKGASGTAAATTAQHASPPPESTPHAGTPLVAPAGILTGLDPDQRAAAEVTEGPLLILAGPGTGKTRTLTHRIAHLVQDLGIAPEACLTITFTRRAAEELRERLDILLGPDGARVPAMTFHALGLRILRAHPELVSALRGDPSEHPLAIAGDQERALLLARALGDDSPGDRRIPRLLQSLSAWKRRSPLGLSALPPDGPQPSEELARAWQAYTTALAQRSLVDLDDLVGLAVVLLEANPEVREAWRARTRTLSIDEYQDIDAQQYRLVQALAPARGDVCAIGDPDQAIYSFRGADVGFFFRFQQDFPDAKLVRLRKNYRSTRTIVDAALQVIAPSPTLGLRELLATFEDARRITLQESPTERAEAEFVVHTVERLIGGSTFFSMDSRRVAADDHDTDFSFSDVAVLYRTEAQADALREAFARSGMPFQRRSHRGIVERPAAEAIARVMRRAPTEEPVLEQLRAALALLRQQAPGESEASEALEGTPSQGPETASAAATEAPLTQADLDTAAELLTPLARRCGEDLRRFLLELGSEIEVDAWDPRADRVSLLTLHASKGLEFRVVFLVGCEDGLLPLRISRDEDPDVAEERRLFYVGMTRARERLYLSWARERLRRGQVVQTAPSPFLREVEDALLDRQQPEARKPKPEPATPDKRQLTLF